MSFSLLRCGLNRALRNQPFRMIVNVMREPRNPDRVGRARAGQGAQPKEARNEDEARETRQARTTPAAIDMVTEAIDGLSRARNQEHRSLLTTAGQSEQWRNAALVLGDLSMRQMERVQ